MWAEHEIQLFKLLLTVVVAVLVDFLYYTCIHLGNQY